MKERREVIDCAKGVAILLVVLGHINSPFGAFIFSFHMPLFFFLSGLFINERSEAKAFVKKNFIRLIIPFFIFGILGWFIELIKDLTLNRSIENLNDSLMGFFWMDASQLHHYGFVLWFLPALFWTRLIIYFLIKYCAFSALGLLFLALVMVTFAVNLSLLPFGLDKGLTALPWTCFGYMFGKFYNCKFVAKTWQLTLILMVVGLAFFLIGIIPLDLANKKLGNTLETIPYTFVMCVGMIAFLTSLKKLYHFRFFKFLIWFGQSTMLVMVFHVYTNNGAYLVIKKLFGYELWPLILLTSTALIVLLMTIKKYFPKIILFKYLD